MKTTRSMAVAAAVLFVRKRFAVGHGAGAQAGVKHTDLLS